MAAGKKHKERYDGVHPFHICRDGTPLYDLLDEHLRPIQLIERPSRPQAAEAAPATPARQPRERERVGRFYLVRHTGWYGLVRVDGTGEERWCANKKAATELARRLTTREAEAERRQHRSA